MRRMREVKKIPILPLSHLTTATWAEQYEVEWNKSYFTLFD